MKTNNSHLVASAPGRLIEPAFRLLTRINATAKSKSGQIQKGACFGLVCLGLLLCGPARAQIALQDGGTNILSNTGSTTISTNITVTAGAKVLVVNLYDRNNNSGLLSPASLTWQAQTLTRVVAVNNGAGTFADSDIYYVFNPTPGSGTITATDASGGTPSAMSIQAFTLNGVNTGVAPIALVTSNSSTTSISINLPGGTPPLGWAVVNGSYGTTPDALTISSTSGTVVTGSLATGAGTSVDMGYVAGVSPNSTITLTEAGGAQKMALGVAVFTPAFPGPAAPTGLTATAGTNKVSLSWTDASGGAATSYIIWRNTSGGTFSVLATNTGNANVTYVDTSVTPQVAYTYTVQAVSGAGAGPFSGTASATPFGIPPSVPNNVVATGGTNKVAVSWSDTSGGAATGYVVLRSITSGSNYIQIATLNGNGSTSYSDNAVYDGTTYYYVVEAFGPGGTSSASTQASGAPFFALAPGQSGSITLVDGGTSSTTTVASGAGSTINSSFSVSPGASVLVVELWDRNTMNNNSSPSFLTWSNSTLATNQTQTLVRAVSENSATTTFSDCDIYYLFNPTPGAGTISGTDTNAVTIQGMTMMGFTLHGVDTTVPPVTYATNNTSATTLSVATAATTPGGSFAAVLAYDGNSGQALSIASTSGSATYNDVNNNQEQAVGYVGGLNSGSSTFSMADASSATKCTLAAAVFMPAIGTGISVQDGNLNLTFSVGSGVTNIVSPFVVTEGADTLVVALEDDDNSGPQGYPGATLLWSNTAFGVMQPLSIGIATNSGQFTWIWTSLYYLMDPLPGPGVIIGTDTNSTHNGMTLQAYTLKGVDTTAAATGIGIGQDGMSDFIDTPGNTPAGSAAAVISDNYNGGGGNTDIIFATNNGAASGGSLETNARPNGIQCTMGIITNLAAGDTTISAVCSGSSTHMDVAAEVFSPLIVLSAPSSVTATGQTNQDLVTWADSSGGQATGYILLRSTSSGSGFTPIATNHGNGSTSFTDTSVTDWTTYFYEVEATSPGGVSIPSAVASAVPMGLPGSVAGLTATPNPTEVDLAWNNQQGVTIFNVLRSTTSGSGYSVIGTSTTNGFADTAVSDGTLYFYEINATNSFGSSANAGPVSAVPVVEFFTNYVGDFNSDADLAGWSDLVSTPTNYIFADAPTYDGPSTECLIMDATYGPANINEFFGIQKQFTTMNVAPYKTLEMDIKNQTGWDEFGQVQGIQVNLQVPVSGNPSYQRGTFGDITLFQAGTGGQWTHYVAPLGDWSAFNLADVTGVGLNTFDGNTTVATEMFLSYANIAFCGAPAWASAFSGVSNQTIGNSATSATLTGTVKGTVASTNVFMAQGSVVTVTINGVAQTTTINDATGDFSINYNTTGLTANTTYPVTYSAANDMVELVGSTNTSTTLTLSSVAPPPTPTILKPFTSGGNLVVSVPTASGFNYYLLSATNLTPPVVWTTNTITPGTGGTITNQVPIVNGVPRLFLRYLVQ